MIPPAVLRSAGRALAGGAVIGLVAWGVALPFSSGSTSATASLAAVAVWFVVVATHSSLRAAEAAPADATAWRLLAAGLAMFTLSVATFAADELFDLPDGWLTAATVFGLLFRVLTAMAMVSFPLPPSSARSRWRGRLELVVVAFTVTYVAWGWLLGGLFHDAQDSPLAARAAIFTLLDIVLVILVLMASVRRAPDARDPARFVGAGLLFLALTDWNIGITVSISGHVTTMAALSSFTALSLIAAGGWAAVHDGSSARQAARKPRTRNLLPILLAALALAAAISTGNLWTDDPVLLILAIGSAASFLGWQVLVVLENEEMIRSLSEQGHRFQTLVETAPIAIIETDTNGIVQVVNSEAARLLEATPEQLVGVTLDLEPRDEAAPDQDLRHRILGGETIRDLRVPVRRADGRDLDLMVSAAPISTDAGGGAHIVWIGSDDGPRLRGLAAMIDIQRMRAFEQLTSGIAHDFNNRLTVILGTSELLLEQASEDDRELLQAVLDAGRRAAALVDQLVSTTRRKFDAQERLDLASLVRQLEPELRRRAPDGAALTVSIASGVLPVHADGSDLEQAVINLVANAYESLDGPGSVTVTVGRAEEGDRAEALLVVADDGAGMAPDVRSRALEPFFTTKGGGGRSRGLGLPAVHGVVLRSHGGLTVESAPGIGTSIRVRLPLDDRVPRARARTSPQEQQPGDGASATILLVDDEPEVRRITARILTAAGHAVVEAEDAESALAALAASPGPVDLLMSDVVMPGRSGIELAHDFAARQPGRPILLLSGFVGETDHGGRAADVPYPLLAKPISGPDLLAAVAAALATATDPSTSDEVDVA